MDDYLEPIYSNYEKSFQAFKTLLTTDYEIEAYPPAIAKDESFGKEFPGSLIRKPKYKNCIFVESQFNSADGSLSRFHDCLFESCQFNNCDLRYCDIFHSSFRAIQTRSTIASCNFTFGNFIDTSFERINFLGCSLRQMQIQGTSFNDCAMQNCSIEQSHIKDCQFENLDLRKVGVRYCTFENTTFKAITFHILDLARNYGLIQQLQKSNEQVYVAYQNDKVMSLDKAIKYLWSLIPYYLETQQFYELINVYAIHDEYDKLLKILPVSFEYAVSSCDFSALQDLCSLIVKLNICTDKQLRDFYTLIKQLIIPNDFPHYLRKSYNSYIENIKYILVDNPYNKPVAEIRLQTDIETLNDADMAQLLMAIETNIKELAPNVDSTIQLVHHSPYDIIITLCGILPDILTVCQVFYYSLGGIKAYSDLKGSRKEKVVKKQPHTNKLDQQKSKRIELSVGKIFSFKYEKEYTKRVESLEYIIK